MIATPWQVSLQLTIKPLDFITGRACGRFAKENVMPWEDLAHHQQLMPSSACVPEINEWARPLI